MKLYGKIAKWPAAARMAVCLALVLLVPACLPAGSWQQPAPMYRQPPPTLAYPQPSRGTYYLPEVEREVLRLANAARYRQGLSPLAGDRALTAAARRHSGDMLARGFFSHVNPDGLSASQRLPRDYARIMRQSGENIWMGSGQNPRDPRHLARTIMDTLMASPGHRRNLLNPGFNRMGVGVAARGQEVRATQIFGQLPAGYADR